MNMYEFKPKSKAQETFISLELKGVFDIGFGGTPNSGKTCCMVVSSLMYAHIPEYRAAFFRREATQLEKAGLIDEAKNWYYKAFPNVEYDSVKRIFKFPSGAMISFNGCEGELDYKKYDGVEWHALYFEELTHFTPDQITNLMSRVRNPKGKIPLRVRSSTNPGGPNEEWVIDRYLPWINKDLVEQRLGVEEAENGDVLYFTSRDGKTIVSKTKKDGYKSFSYIIPKINDLSEEQEARVHAINDPIRRAQLLGKWGVKNGGGQYFNDNDIQIWTGPINNGNRVRYWDLAASGKKGDFMASILCNKVKDQFFIEDIVYLKPEVHEVEDIIYKYAKQDGKGITVCLEQEPGSAGKILANSFESKLKQMGFKVIIDLKGSDKTTASKEARAALVSPLAKTNKIWLANLPSVLTGSTELKSQLTQFPVGKHDDLVDCLAGAVYVLNNKYTSNAWNIYNLNRAAPKINLYDLDSRTW